MDEATRKAMAAALGLSEDSSEEQITAEVTRLQAAAAPTTPGEGGPEAGVPATPGEGGPTADDVSNVIPLPIAAAADDGTVRVDKGTLEELKRGAALAVAHEETDKAKRITETVSAAVEVGKIPPARRGHWEKQLAADFDGAKAILDGLDADTIPLGARGNSGADHEAGANSGDGQGLPDEWFPEVAAARAAALTPQRVMQAREG